MGSVSDGEGHAGKGTGWQLLVGGISVVHEEGTHSEYVVHWVGFGEVVTEVLNPRSPVDPVMSNAHALTDPVVAHQNGLGTPLLDAIIGNALGTVIVGLEGSGTLWITQIVESVPQGFSLLPIDEEGDVLCFSRRRDNSGDDCAHNVDSSVEGAVVGCPAEIPETACA